MSNLAKIEIHPSFTKSEIEIVKNSNTVRVLNLSTEEMIVNLSDSISNAILVVGNKSLDATEYYCWLSHPGLAQVTTVVFALDDTGGNQGGKSFSLESAENVTSRDGIRYGDIESDKLAHMLKSLTKSLSR